MATVKIDDTLRMYYETYDFVSPWRSPETILLVHGVAESSRVWYGWIPRLAKKYRVVCIDLRGFGKSTIPPEGYQWSVANFARDISIFMNKSGLKKVHLVGAKLGGTIALQTAHDYPENLHSLTVVGGPVSFGQGRANVADWAKVVRERGVEYWARATMKDRLGDVSTEMTEWWVRLFASNSPRVVAEVLGPAARIDLSPLLPEIKVPTLMIDGGSDLLASGDAVKRWQKLIPDSELVVLPGNLYHVAASKPDECVSALLHFLKRNTARG
jgi:pimeloyl-ACP methyl ester carboxylesterase